MTLCGLYGTVRHFCALHPEGKLGGCIHACLLGEHTTKSMTGQELLAYWRTGLLQHACITRRRKSPMGHNGEAQSIIGWPVVVGAGSR